MISLQLLGTAVAAALVGSTVSASSLPQRRAVPNGFPDTLATIIETSAGEPRAPFASLFSRCRQR